MLLKSENFLNESLESSLSLYKTCYSIVGLPLSQFLNEGKQVSIESLTIGFIFCFGSLTNLFFISSAIFHCILSSSRFIFEGKNSFQFDRLTDSHFVPYLSHVSWQFLTYAPANWWLFFKGSLHFIVTFAQIYANWSKIFLFHRQMKTSQAKTSFTYYVYLDFQATTSRTSWLPMTSSLRWISPSSSPSLISRTRSFLVNLSRSVLTLKQIFTAASQSWLFFEHIARVAAVNIVLSSRDFYLEMSSWLFKICTSTYKMFNLYPCACQDF